MQRVIFDDIHCNSGLKNIVCSVPGCDDSDDDNGGVDDDNDDDEGADSSDTSESGEEGSKLCKQFLLISQTIISNTFNIHIF